jgi:hypothetical protein
MIVAEILHQPRARAAVRVFRHEWRVGVFVFEIFVDDRGIVNDEAFVVERRHLTERMNFQIFRSFLLFFGEIDGDALELESFLDEGDTHFARVGRCRRVVKLDHGPKASLAEMVSIRHITGEPYLLYKKRDSGGFSRG